MVDVDTYQKISLQDNAIAQFANKQLEARGLSTEGTLNDKMHRLYGEGAMDKLLKNIELRNRSTIMHWQSMLGMPQGSLQIESPSRSDIQQHDGKTRYKVEIITSDEFPTDSVTVGTTPIPTDTIPANTAS